VKYLPVNARNRLKSFLYVTQTFECISKVSVLDSFFQVRNGIITAGIRSKGLYPMTNIEAQLLLSGKLGDLRFLQQLLRNSPFDLFNIALCRVVERICRWRRRSTEASAGRRRGAGSCFGKEEIVVSVWWWDVALRLECEVDCYVYVAKELVCIERSTSFVNSRRQM